MGEGGSREVAGREVGRDGEREGGKRGKQFTVIPPEAAGL